MGSDTGLSQSTTDTHAFIHSRTHKTMQHSQSNFQHLFKRWLETGGSVMFKYIYIYIPNFKNNLKPVICNIFSLCFACCWPWNELPARIELFTSTSFSLKRYSQYIVLAEGSKKNPQKYYFFTTLFEKLWHSDMCNVMWIQYWCKYG